MGLDVLALMAALLSPLSQEPHRGLRDSECGKEDVLVGLIEGVSVHVRCESGAMYVTVRNDGSTGLLRSFSIGFCGQPVVGVRAPAGWYGAVEGSDAMVTWSLEDGIGAGAVPREQRLTGFSVTLRPGWRMSRSMDVQWLPSASAGTATTHDCLN